jgi:hypothetical protein
MTDREQVAAAGGTVVYVHGASDRQRGVDEHVARIEASLARRGSRMRVLAARWGDEAGPDLKTVCHALPDSEAVDACPDQARIGTMRSWIHVVAAAAVVLQYLHKGVPRRVGVWATDRLRSRREAWMQEILGVADALAYQRDGAAIQAVVRSTLQGGAERRPLVAIGNSLGGIILFDALRLPDMPRPDLFVTVGSQAPVLRTIHALGDDEPPPFQPWLNIYDPRDFFAFVAERVWPAESGIVDRRVDLGLGFPAVHGPAYLSDPTVFDAIFEHPALAGPP